MKAFLKILVPILFCGILQGQTDYQVSYSYDDYHSVGNDIVVEKEGQVFVSNLYHKQNGDLFPYDAADRMLSVTKTDEHGNIIWNKAMENGYEFTDAARIIKTLEEEYVVAESFDYKSEHFEFMAVSVTKLDDQGNQHWTKAFGPGLLLSIKVKPNGNLMILSFLDPNTWIESSSPVYQLTEMDQSGHIVNYKFIKTPNSIVCLGEGSIEIMKDNSVVFATGSVTGAVFISRHDAQLNMMWNRVLEVDDHYIYTPILKINENQDIVVGADLSMKTTHEKALALITVTKNGQLSTNWSLQKIFSYDQSELNIMDLEYNQGNYYISGWDFHSTQNQGTINPSNSIVSPFRILINYNNNINEAVRFYNNSATHPDHLRNSDVLAGQWASIGGYDDQNIWVTRSHDMTSTECAETDMTLVQMEIQPQLTELEEIPVEQDYMTLSAPMNVFDKGIQKVYCPLFSISLEKETKVQRAFPNPTHTVTKAYPNPSSGHIGLTLSDKFNPKEMISISIFNLLGQQMKSFEIYNQRSKLNLSDLPQGQYVVIARQNTTMDQLKIIKQ